MKDMMFGFMKTYKRLIINNIWTVEKNYSPFVLIGGFQLFIKKVYII